MQPQQWPIMRFQLALLAFLEWLSMILVRLAWQAAIAASSPPTASRSASPTCASKLPTACLTLPVESIGSIILRIPAGDVRNINGVDSTTEIIL
eukprot:1639094-Pleurochrysis_carterae.AAC.2